MNTAGRSTGTKLAFVLRLLGYLDMLAAIAVFMPQSWFEVTNQAAGLGVFPKDTLSIYLARTGPSFYVLHGALLVFLSTDVMRYRPVIQFVGWSSIAHAFVLLWIDVISQMPVYWIALEGPGIAAVGTVILLLLPDQPRGDALP